VRAIPGTERVYRLVELTASREGWGSLRFSIEVRHCGVNQLPCPECPRTFVLAARPLLCLRNERSRIFPGFVIASSGVAAVSNRFAVHNDSEQSLPEVLSLDPLYLFVSYLEWRIEGNLASLGELLAALADANEEVHLVAKSLITENSACPILPDRNQDRTTH
jgi:hypothetical protein